MYLIDPVRGDFSVTFYPHLFFPCASYLPFSSRLHLVLLMILQQTFSVPFPMSQLARSLQSFQAFLPNFFGDLAQNGWEVGRKRELLFFLLLVVHPAATAVSSGLQENLWQFQEYSAGLQTQQMLFHPNDGSTGHAYSISVTISQKLRTWHLSKYRMNIIKYFIQFSH